MRPQHAVKRPHQSRSTWEPNALWQMDFMGHQPLRQGSACHPWSLLDDHSRFALDLVACPNQQWTTVQTALTAAFRQFGLPQAILCDNGESLGHGRERGHLPPGGVAAAPRCRTVAWPTLSPPDARQGRTLPRHHRPRGLRSTPARPHSPRPKRRFDAFRTIYNHERPHEALANLVPASAYQPAHSGSQRKTPLPARRERGWGEGSRDSRENVSLRYRPIFQELRRERLPAANPSFSVLPYSLTPSSTTAPPPTVLPHPAA